MGGQYGVSELIKCVELGAELANVGSKLLNKKGLVVLFQLTDEAAAMGALDVDLLKKEISELDQHDRDTLLSAAKAKLDLSNDVLEKKIEQGFDLVDECISFAVEGLALFARAKAVFASDSVPVSA